MDFKWRAQIIMYESVEEVIVCSDIREIVNIGQVVCRQIKKFRRKKYYFAKEIIRAYREDC